MDDLITRAFADDLPAPVDLPSDTPLGERAAKALSLAINFGGSEGEHHKQWVIDQMTRALAGDSYDELVDRACDGEDGPETYEWDEGIAP